MKTLQEIINESLETKILQVKEHQLGSLAKSKEILSCPNCKTKGMASGMRVYHMDNCKRIPLYSNECIIADYNNGVPLTDIAHKSSMKVTAIHKLMRDMGHTKRRQKMANRPIIEKMYLDGKSCREISVSLKQPLNTVKNIVSDMKSQTNPIGDTCPNCSFTGPKKTLSQYHFNNCKRTKGYSDEKVIERYQSGISVKQISLESNISISPTFTIIKKWKASNNI
jgi:transposase